MSSIDISAVDVLVDASSGSSWDGSDSELEVEVTHVVQQQKAEEEEDELDLELDESHKSSKTSLPTKPAEGLPKVPSPRPAVQKTIVNFFSDATVTVAQTQSTTSKKKKNGRGKADGKAAARGGGNRCLPNSTRSSAAHSEKTGVIRLHKDRRKGAGGDREAEKEEEVGVSGAHSEQKPHNEQNSSGQNKNRNNWHILASRSGSRSARNKQMLRAEMPP